MHRYLALALFLVLPMSAQLHRGNAGSCFSNFHNFHCIPIDGGAVYAWDMNNPASANCQAGGTPVPNNATFTGSSATTFACGGGTPPTITSTGLSVPNNGLAEDGGAVPSVPNGWTIAAVFDLSQNGVIMGNLNYPSNSVCQYSMYTFTNTVELAYAPSGTFQQFVSSTTPNSLNAWNFNAVAYTSASATSATLWYGKKQVTGTWTTGTGTGALPSVQVVTDVGTLKGNDSQSIGTIGYLTLHDHHINASAEGFIYNAMYRAMQFRGVAIP